MHPCNSFWRIPAALDCPNTVLTFLAVKDNTPVIHTHVIYIPSFASLSHLRFSFAHARRFRSWVRYRIYQGMEFSLIFLSGKTPSLITGKACNQKRTLVTQLPYSTRLCQRRIQLYINAPKYVHRVLGGINHNTLHRCPDQSQPHSDACVLTYLIARYRTSKRRQSWESTLQTWD